MLDRAFHVAAAFGVLLAAAPVGTAYAHGQPAAITEVVAADESGPWLLQLTEGLAFRAPEGWRFVCPALVGSEGFGLLAAASGGAEAWIGGAADLYRMDRTGVIRAALEPRLTGNFMIAWGAAGPGENNLYALELVDGGSELLRLGASGAEALWADALEWQTFAVFGDDLLLGYAFDTRLELAALTHDGELLRRSSLTLEQPAFSASLRPAGDRLFLVASGAAGSELLELSGDTSASLFESPLGVDGPVAAADGTLWASANGELLRVAAGALEPVASPAPSVCVGRSSGAAYGCTHTQLFELTERGPGALVFDLGEVGPPRPELHGAPASALCESQWQIFRQDLQRAGAIPFDPEPEPSVEPEAAAGAQSAPASGCGVGFERRSAESRWLGASAALLVIGLRNRRRPKGGRKP